ncbi:hypothetical protein T265_07439 [Opisthorchis viverrini]|uniref:Uncharacterized protein n=1 Tax=Opisthorchis viverrini TaxID=6198 RepID=A0A075ABL9_OPIVI|nr:hypothetical protein T265_07439 [Opisthorchis viverrini]KER25049.1 hypothetical protein T265_07439 [Opisthorchis viverrini]
MINKSTAPGEDAYGECSVWRGDDGCLGAASTVPSKRVILIRLCNKLNTENVEDDKMTVMAIELHRRYQEPDDIVCLENIGIAEENLEQEDSSPTEIADPPVLQDFILLQSLSLLVCDGHIRFIYLWRLKSSPAPKTVTETSVISRGAVPLAISRDHLKSRATGEPESQASDYQPVNALENTQVISSAHAK